ncbi:hypothetical protein FKX85_05840 [Echinicola soli]|uniref:Uncharacterized protein n=1 Tax=Echinicola soli TaxID=2591634 RepID=A0A514CFG5_9BACT|nr:DUF6624 domain-containing protein [Echinicola soli]QDH78577.1 hypothetical protein FKX85_05840 [Echinicola soli]
MDYKDLSETIIGLKNADLELRDKLVRKGQLGKGYSEEMAALHNRNAKLLDEIMDRIGYPTSDKVGKRASEAAWLVIQHSIGQPGFMKRSAKLLESAVREDKADPINLAYLTDRIAVLEGKLQLYGTQFDWDENGEMSPSPIDDMVKVNGRRKSIGLKPLEEQTRIMRRRMESENQLPPTDLEKRERQYDEWRASVGWIK